LQLINIIIIIKWKTGYSKPKDKKRCSQSGNNCMLY